MIWFCAVAHHSLNKLSNDFNLNSFHFDRLFMFVFIMWASVFFFFLLLAGFRFLCEGIFFSFRFLLDKISQRCVGRLDLFFTQTYSTLVNIYTFAIQSVSRTFNRVFVLAFVFSIRKTAPEIPIMCVIVSCVKKKKKKQIFSHNKYIHRSLLSQNTLGLFSRLLFIFRVFILSLLSCVNGCVPFAFNRLSFIHSNVV